MDQRLGGVPGQVARRLLRVESQQVLQYAQKRHLLRRVRYLWAVKIKSNQIVYR